MIYETKKTHQYKWIKIQDTDNKVVSQYYEVVSNMVS